MDRKFERVIIYDFDAGEACAFTVSVSLIAFEILSRSVLVSEADKFFSVLE